MRTVIQRVRDASVKVDGQLIGSIDKGLLCYAGFAHEDSLVDVDWMAEKIVALRVFDDAQGKLAYDVREFGGSILVISQFTLLADLRKGRRPSFTQAMAPDAAEALYQAFILALRARKVPIETGKFRADMKVTSLNDGPITLLIDSPRENAPHAPKSGVNPLTSEAKP